MEKALVEGGSHISDGGFKISRLGSTVSIAGLEDSDCCLLEVLLLGSDECISHKSSLFSGISKALLESNNVGNKLSLQLLHSINESTADVVVVDLVDPGKLSLNSVVESVNLFGDGVFKVSPCSFHDERKSFSS